MRKFRKKGIAQFVAQSIWTNQPGSWQVRVWENNTIAQQFWNNAIEKFMEKTIINQDHYYSRKTTCHTTAFNRCHHQSCCHTPLSKKWLYNLWHRASMTSFPMAIFKFKMVTTRTIHITRNHFFSVICW